MPTPFNPPLEDRPRVGKTNNPSNQSYLFIPVKLCLHTKFHELQALVDSATEQSLIDHDLVSQLALPTKLLDTPVEAAGLGGQHLSRITHRTKPIHPSPLLITMNIFNSK